MPPDSVQLSQSAACSNNPSIWTTADTIPFRSCKALAIFSDLRPGPYGALRSPHAQSGPYGAHELRHARLGKLGSVTTRPIRSSQVITCITSDEFRACRIQPARNQARSPSIVAASSKLHHSRPRQRYKFRSSSSVSVIFTELCDVPDVRSGRQANPTARLQEIPGPYGAHG